MHACCIFFAGVWLMAAAGEVHGRALYVAPHGQDTNPGTSADAAFKTINQAAQKARAGDTVNILPGTYAERIRPINSGTPERPIVYRKYGDSEVVISTLPATDGGAWLERFAFKLGTINYTIVDGLTFRDAEGWIYIGDHAHHVTVRHCVFDRCRMYHGIFIDSGHHNRIESCRFVQAMPFPDNGETEDKEPANLADYISIWGDSRFNLVEACEFNAITHVAISIMAQAPAGRPSHNIIRNCRFNEPRWKCVGFHSAEHTLLENNTMTGLSASFIQYQAGTIIMRRNILHHYRRTTNTWAPERYYGALWLRSTESEYGTMDLAQHGRIYNNVFYDNQVVVTYKAGKTPPVCENVFKNNIFYKFDVPLRLPLPVYSSYSLHEPNYFFNNIILGRTPGGKVVDLSTKDSSWIFSLNETNDKMREITRPAKPGAHPVPLLFKDNLETDPRFSDPDKEDFTLRKDSPCIDRGAMLTHTMEAGQGTVVMVADPLYFCDGWDMIAGDLVVVGKNRAARLLKVDYDRNTLTLDTKIVWEKDAPVSLPYQGAAPDIGAHEYGSDAGH